MNNKILVLLLLAIILCAEGCISQGPQTKNKTVAALTTEINKTLPVDETDVLLTLTEAGFGSNQRVVPVTNETYVTKINYPPINYDAWATNVTKFGNASIVAEVPGNLNATARRAVIDKETKFIRSDFNALIENGFGNISLQLTSAGLTPETSGHVNTMSRGYAGTAKKDGRVYSITDNTIITDLDGFSVNREHYQKLKNETPDIITNTTKYNIWLRTENMDASVEAYDQVTYEYSKEITYPIGKEHTDLDHMHDTSLILDHDHHIVYKEEAQSFKPFITVTVKGPDRIAKVKQVLQYVQYCVSLDHYKFGTTNEPINPTSKTSEPELLVSNDYAP